MKKYFFLSTFLCLSFLTFAQTTTLLDFNQNRLKKQKTAMTILGTWAVGNIALGSVLASRQEGETKYFNQMNAGWNAVNLVIAGFGYFGAMKMDAATLDMYGSIQEHYKIQKVLLFNAGLDIGYMLGGAYLIERSKNRVDNAERLSGFGKSIALQGAFLFVFDLITYATIAADNDNIQFLLNNDG
ncbi:MAG: hypothetical protein AAFO82_12510, partial [Bacteroidota bacterium]